MSTYYSIFGEVTCTPAAWSALRTLTTAEWLDDTDSFEDNILSVTDVGDDMVVGFHGSFRNLGRYLESDLASAALIGDIEGQITVVCTDGTTFMSVSRFAPAGVVYHATSDCLAAGSLVGYRSVPVTLGSGNMFRMSLLSPLLTADGDVITETLEPWSPWAEECSCGGWDDTEEQPICAGPQPSASDPAVHPVPPVGGDPVGAVERFDAVLAGARPRLDDAPLARCAALARTGRGVFRRDEPWQVSWARALTAPVLSPGMASTRSRQMPMETRVAAALLLRGVATEFAHLPPLDTDGLVGVLAGLSVDGDLSQFGLDALVASHPALTPGIAARVARRAPRELAANPACPSEVLAALPGKVVADAAPGRLVDDPADVELVRVLGVDWFGTAGALAQAVADVAASAR